MTSLLRPGSWRRRWGTLYRVSGELALAQECQRLLEMSREVGSSWDDAHALAALGRCALNAVGGPRPAR